VSVYGISSRARDYIRRRASYTMEATCRIERVLPPVFDQTSGRATSGSRTTIYEGKCRIWEVNAGSGVVNIGDDDILMPTTQLSLPWDIDPIPDRKDQVLITDHDSDSSMIGQRFEIQSHVKAGDLRATRRFTVLGFDQR